MSNQQATGAPNIAVKALPPVAGTRRVDATTSRTRRPHASPHETSGGNYLDSYRARRA